jgi:hypothetical protein
MQNVDLRKRRESFKRRLDKSSKHTHLLPEYPVEVTPHMGDATIRQRRKMIYKKYTFEHRHGGA